MGQEGEGGPGKGRSRRRRRGRKNKAPPPPPPPPPPPQPSTTPPPHPTNHPTTLLPQSPHHHTHKQERVVVSGDISACNGGFDWLEESDVTGQDVIDWPEESDGTDLDTDDWLEESDVNDEYEDSDWTEEGQEKKKESERDVEEKREKNQNFTQNRRRQSPEGAEDPKTVYDESPSGSGQSCRMPRSKQGEIDDNKEEGENRVTECGEEEKEDGGLKKCVRKRAQEVNQKQEEVKRKYQEYSRERGLREDLSLHFHECWEEEEEPNQRCLDLLLFVILVISVCRSSSPPQHLCRPRQPRHRGVVFLAITVG
ncbi:proline-, glutamic acid- and leucine-rich protein 1-like [Scylla paramamosain]|uniref:proline-, glutamic acid- and leucine-rich protein 1-like n=1 Tax=Scylla paramamosain TaxID=85552 RepID=UPI0030833DFE